MPNPVITPGRAGKSLSLRRTMRVDHVIRFAFAKTIIKRKRRNVTLICKPSVIRHTWEDNVPVNPHFLLSKIKPWEYSNLSINSYSFTCYTNGAKCTEDNCIKSKTTWLEQQCKKKKNWASWCGMLEGTWMVTWFVSFSLAKTLCLSSTLFLLGKLFILLENPRTYFSSWQITSC